MDIALVFVLTSIYKIAESAGLIEYVTGLPKKAADALLEKFVQDKAAESQFLKEFFTPPVEKAFRAALSGVAPDNEILKQRFLCAVLTAPAIIQALDALEKGQVPQRSMLEPVFQIVLPARDAAQMVDRFVDTLYAELSKDQEHVNQVVLRISERMGGQDQLLREIRDIVKTNTASPSSTRHFFLPRFRTEIIELSPFLVRNAM